VRSSVNPGVVYAGLVQKIIDAIRTHPDDRKVTTLDELHPLAGENALEDNLWLPDERDEISRNIRRFTAGYGKCQPLTQFIAMLTRGFSCESCCS
jgi:hypothetical protein